MPDALRRHARFKTDDNGKEAAFGTYILLSLVFHLVIIGVVYLVANTFRQVTHDISVIEIDLSHIEATERQKASPMAKPVPRKKTSPASGAIVSKQSAPAVSHQVGKKDSGTAAAGQATAKIRTAAENQTIGRSPSGVNSERSDVGSAATAASTQTGGRNAATRTGTGKSEKLILADYAAIVRAAIERHKEYPRAARRIGIRGSVIVSFSLDRHGNLRTVSLARSSGYSMLDDAGIRAVRNAGRFPPPPREIMNGEEISFSLPITFTLS